VWADADTLQQRRFFPVNLHGIVCWQARYNWEYTNGFVYRTTNLSECCNIQSCDQLLDGLVDGNTEVSGLRCTYLLYDIDISTHTELPELISKHCSVESELFPACL
jgi:hypothetical protein